jgi:hypothetical protein
LAALRRKDGFRRDFAGQQHGAAMRSCASSEYRRHPPVFARKSIPPEVLEPVRRQRRVNSGAGDRPMAKPALDRTGIVSLRRLRIAFVLKPQ